MVSVVVDGEVVAVVSVVIVLVLVVFVFNVVSVILKGTLVLEMVDVVSVVVTGVLVVVVVTKSNRLFVRNLRGHSSGHVDNMNTKGTLFYETIDFK